MRYFTCDLCRGEFTTEMTMDEVLAEEQDLFGFVSTEESRASLCEDCFQVFMTWFNALEPEERAEMDLRARQAESSWGGG